MVKKKKKKPSKRTQTIKEWWRDRKEKTLEHILVGSGTLAGTPESLPNPASGNNTLSKVIEKQYWGTASENWPESM